VNEEPLEPLDPELDALLDAERAAAPPAASLDRVWARVSHGAAGGAGNPHEGMRHSLASRAASIGIGAFVAGVVVGALGHAMLHATPPPRVVYLDRVVAAPPASSSPVVQENAPTPPAPPPPASTERTASAPPSAAAVPSTLSAERAVLEDARAALATGDAARALSLLDQHVHRFPKPQLAEEREALAIQALVLLQQYGEARARASRFRASAPNSLFLPAIDASLASIP
jgi:hypothetical protein